MRVAQIMAGARHGGAEAFYERLVPALARAGVETLAVIRREPGRAARLAAVGLAPLELGFGGPLDFLTRPRLSAALARFAPAVAVSWMNRATRFTPAGPWVHVGRLGGFYDLRHYARCRHLAANTRGIRAWIVEQGWPEGRVHYLPNFVADPAGTTPAAREDGAAPLLLAMGRLHANKGFDVLLRALALLPAVRLWLAGEGPERAALERLAGELGLGARLRLLGWREDGAALRAACDLFVCSSRHEPLGNVVLEAWASARAVVAAAAQGPAELIADGRTGLLVPPDDPAALAAAIARLLADRELAARLAAAGRAAYEAEFTEARVVAAWRAFLERVAA